MNGQTKYIVWDWNGTLLDDTADVLRCINIVLEKISRPPIDYETLSNAHDNWPPKKCDGSDWPVRSFYRDIGVDEEGLSLLEPVERDIFHDNYNRLGNLAPLRAGTTELLNDFGQAGIRSLILSNHLSDEIRKQLTRLAIDHHFSEVLAFKCRLTQFKDMTKGERLKHFMNQEKFDPAKTVIVGDTIEEIFIARDLGLTSVAITGGLMSEAKLRAAKPDHLIHSLPELKQIVRERVMA